MARGVPLTPEQAERIAEVYNATGNYSEAARAVGVDSETARRCILRRGERNRADLHARAIRRGQRKGRARLERVANLIDNLLAGESMNGPGMEPRDVAMLANALGKNIETLLALEERLERRLTSALTRRRTRAELKVLERAGSADGTIRIVVEHEGDTPTVATDAPPMGDRPLD